MRPVSIDTNLLLLFLVGSTSKKYIAIHKRLTAYSIADFEILVDIISRFSEIVVVAHTLAETGNLIRHIRNPFKAAILEKMRVFINTITEIPVSSARGANRAEFFELGLTDAILLEMIAAEGKLPILTLLTHDRDLAIAAEMQGCLVINFEHHRIFE